MRKLILTALVAATLVPAAAEAQWRGDQNRDRREARDDRGDRRDHRDDRSRRWGDNDWRDYRGVDREVYSRGNWHAPFGYYAFRPGIQIAPRYYGSPYWINDPWRFRLPPAGYGQRWVRHYNDVLLIDIRHGIVLRVLNNFYW